MGFLGGHVRSKRRGSLLIHGRNERVWLACTGRWSALDGPGGIGSLWQEMSAEARREFLYHALKCESLLLRRPDEEVRSLLAIARQARTSRGRKTTPEPTR